MGDTCKFKIETYFFLNESSLDYPMNTYLIVNLCHLDENFLLDNFQWDYLFFSTSMFLPFWPYIFTTAVPKHLMFYHRTLNCQNSHLHKCSPFTFLLKTFLPRKYYFRKVLSILALTRGKNSMFILIITKK